MKNKILFSCWLVLIVGCLMPLTAISEPKQKLPEISLPDLNGKNQLLNQWQGKKLLINFWATWCAPCRKEMPDLVSWQKEFKEKGLQVIGIALDDAKSVSAYLHESPVNYPVLLAPELGAEVSAELGNTMGVLPYSAFVGRKGVVQLTHTGLVTKKMVDDWMQD